jgi:hypothetical protein
MLDIAARGWRAAPLRRMPAVVTHGRAWRRASECSAPRACRGWPGLTTAARPIDRVGRIDFELPT